LEVSPLKISYIVLAIILSFGVIISGCNSGSTAAQAKNGDTVQVNYTGKLADGTVFDSTAGHEPFEFKLGAGQVIPGFEKAVLGMTVGERKTVTIPADEAYGPRNDNMVIEIGRDKLASDVTPQVGQQLQSKRDDGSIVVVIVTKVTDTTITIDANHPLAGRDLTFEFELVKIL
jgi:peptidylprolyl isomerase